METTKRSQEINQTTRQESATRPSQPSAATAPKNLSTSERSSEETRTAMEGAKQKISDAYDRTASSLNETYGKVVDYGKENPGKMTLIAFGAGVGVGLLLASGLTTPRSRTGRIVPPVMNALSEIASQLFR